MMRMYEDIGFDDKVFDIYHPAPCIQTNQTNKKYITNNISPYDAYRDYMFDNNMFDKMFGVFLLSLEDPAPFVKIETTGKK